MLHIAPNGTMLPAPLRFLFDAKILMSALIRHQNNSVPTIPSSASLLLILCMVYPSLLLLFLMAFMTLLQEIKKTLHIFIRISLAKYRNWNMKIKNLHKELFCFCVFSKKPLYFCHRQKRQHMKHLYNIASLLCVIPSLFTMEMIQQNDPLLLLNLQQPFIDAIESYNADAYAALWQKTKKSSLQQLFAQSTNTNPTIEQNSILARVKKYAARKPLFIKKRFMRVAFGIASIGYGAAYIFHSLRCDGFAAQERAGHIYNVQQWEKYDCSPFITNQTCAHINTQYVQKNLPACTSHTEAFSWDGGLFGLLCFHGALQIKAAVENIDGTVAYEKSQRIKKLTEEK